MERKKNAIRNIWWGTINKLILTVIPFITRTVIIKVLGNEYLGLNSLFTSILDILNLTELGISSAIIFFMYKPIAEKDEKTISALLNLYKKLYRIIGIIILTIGLVILPFLRNFIKGSVPDGINIYILYLIYLINTVSTYWLFAYKKSLMLAFQRNDIISNINSALVIIKTIFQVTMISIFKNYYLYVIINPVITITENIICNIITNKYYPQYVPRGTISKEIKNGIKKKVYGLMIHRACISTRNSLDSIFISAFLGLNMVAIYNNYYYIMTAVKSFLGVITGSIVSGVGNSITTESVSKNYNDMNKFNFMYMLIAGWCTICLLCLYQPFMKLWVGQEYMLDFVCVILFCVYFYTLCMGEIKATYSDAAGLWWESRHRAIIETITNVILNFVLGKLFGLKGIIIATLISLLVINFLYDSTIIFKHYFKEQKVFDYYKEHIKYFIVTLFIAIITFVICSFVSMGDFADLIIKGIICIIVPTVLYFVIYRKNEYLYDMKDVLLKFIKRK